MPAPLVAARVEERDDLFRDHINSRYICSFMIIAREASQTEVSGPGRAVVLLGDDMVDFEGKVEVFLG
jgi:hypothetical protein